MSAASVTVHDRVSFTASVSPDRAAAYVRAKLPGWHEHRCPEWYRFEPQRDDGPDTVFVPTAIAPDFAKLMVELCRRMVALGCAQQPSQVLAAMAAIEP